jgi:hypothetical protein
MMLKKLKAFFSGKLNESGALPAIMAGAILISATAVLLAGFSVTLTRNAEINSVKTNVNYYLNACEATLETETYKTFPSQFESQTKQAIKDRIAECSNPNAVNGAPLVTIYLVGEPELYTPAGETFATSVKVVLGVDISKGSFKSNGYTQAVKYLDYAEREDNILTVDSYIESFDSNDNAVWVTP